MQQQLSPNNDPLWEVAKKRASFKKSLISYVFVNLFLIAIWYFTSNDTNVTVKNFWPIWPILGWGLGLILKGFDAYAANPVISEQKEYEKLKNK